MKKPIFEVTSKLSFSCKQQVPEKMGTTESVDCKFPKCSSVPSCLAVIINIVIICASV